MSWKHSFWPVKFIMCFSQRSIVFTQHNNKFLITKFISIHGIQYINQLIVLLSLPSVTAETTTVTDSTTSFSTVSTTLTDSTSSSTEPVTSTTTTSTSTTSTTVRTPGTCPDTNNVCKIPDEFVAIPGYCGPDYYICVSCSPYVHVWGRFIFPRAGLSFFHPIQTCPGDAIFDPVFLACVPSELATCGKIWFAALNHQHLLNKTVINLFRDIDPEFHCPTLNGRYPISPGTTLILNFPW